MTPLFLATCFMFIAALLLLAVVYSKVHWVLKAGLIVASLGFAGMFYMGYVNALGYPVVVTPPTLFQFLYAYVREPYPAKEDAGAIDVWMIEVGGSHSPRAIELPYSTELRREVAQATRMVQQNQTVYMGSTKGEGSAISNKSGREGHAGGRGDNAVPYEVKQVPTLEFKRPPDTLPQKLP